MTRLECSSKVVGAFCAAALLASCVQQAAQAVALRYELYMVDLRLNGQKSFITVAEPVQAEGGFWGIETDYLGEHGWMSEQEDQL